MAYREYESQRNRDRIRFEMKEHIGVLSTKENGWRREVNLVAWNGGADKIDIREWDPNHERMTKGVTLFEEEAETLAMALADRYGLRLVDKSGRYRTANSRPAAASSGQSRASNDAAFGVESAHNNAFASREGSGFASRSSFGVRTAPPTGQVSHGRVFAKWDEAETANDMGSLEHKSGSDPQGDTIPFEHEGRSASHDDASSAGHGDNAMTCEASAPQVNANYAGYDNNAMAHEESAPTGCGGEVMAVAESPEAETAEGNDMDEEIEADEACDRSCDAEPEDQAATS